MQKAVSYAKGGNKILQIKCLYYQDIRATQPNFIGVFLMPFSKKSICCFSKPQYIRLEGRRQEKERAAFSRN